MKPAIRLLVETTDRRELAERSRKAQAQLHVLLTGKQRVLDAADWERFLNKLGLTSQPVSDLFGEQSADVRFLLGSRPSRTHVPRIEVHTIRPAFRAGREGRQIEQVIVTLTQQVVADVGTRGARRPMVFRGGSSLILSLGNLNTVEYVVVKNIRSYDRFREQLAYLRGEGTAFPLRVSPYEDDERPSRLDFNMLHRF